MKSWKSRRTSVINGYYDSLGIARNITGILPKFDKYFF